MKILFFILTPLLIYGQSISLQILDSGDPEFFERASSSYIIWVDGKARGSKSSGTHTSAYRSCGRFTTVYESGVFYR